MRFCSKHGHFLIPTCFRFSCAAALVRSHACAIPGHATLNIKIEACMQSRILVPKHRCSSFKGGAPRYVNCLSSTSPSPCESCLQTSTQTCAWMLLAQTPSAQQLHVCGNTGRQVCAGTCRPRGIFPATTYAHAQTHTHSGHIVQLQVSHIFFPHSLSHQAWLPGGITPLHQRRTQSNTHHTYTCTDTQTNTRHTYTCTDTHPNTHHSYVHKCTETRRLLRTFATQCPSHKAWLPGGGVCLLRSQFGGKQGQEIASRQCLAVVVVEAVGAWMHGLAGLGGDSRGSCVRMKGECEVKVWNDEGLQIEMMKGHRLCDRQGA